MKIAKVIQGLNPDAVLEFVSLDLGDIHSICSTSSKAEWFNHAAMSKIPILQPNNSYTFRSYFEMAFEPEDILAEFGYSLKRSSLNQQKSTIELDRLANLKSRIEESFIEVAIAS
ncbi:hypothetical protein [Nostoc sp. ChiQUE01b]|uniref:hypothetical protein n=1 Tax=Nostoc sp. ChiQUE01b TaxID=3075376 RepID=UPI002AD50403|nr:hypothetical protein [Nostoc sp. ChiQUE01b]MDZ8260871.1 hypothetical protein [Nostoc sp. ChiQUE01b]